MSQTSPIYEYWPEGISQYGNLSGEALFAELATRAAATPDRCAIPSSGATYGELLDASQMLAGYMQQRLGVRHGCSVVLALDDCPQRAVAVFAVARCAARLVAVDPGCTAGGIATGAAGSGARAAIVTAASLPTLAPLLDNGTLYGCVLCGGAPVHPALHDFAGALSAGIAPLPLNYPLDTWSTKHELA
ncbi:AMP-binding protein [Cupriavidus basilensis]